MNTAGRLEPRTIVAGMGELKVVCCAPDETVFLKTTVGSCVGLFLADAKNRIYGLAHIMLPQKLRENDSIGKYADTAMPELLRQIGMINNTGSVQAYVVGGASMFGSETRSFVSDVGRRNVEAVLGMTRRLRIPIVHEETGGHQGRTAILDCRDATISVRTLRKLETTAGGDRS